MVLVLEWGMVRIAVDAAIAKYMGKYDFRGYWFLLEVMKAVNMVAFGNGNFSFSIVLCFIVPAGASCVRPRCHRTYCKRFPSAFKEQIVLSDENGICRTTVFKLNQESG